MSGIVDLHGGRRMGIRLRAAPETLLEEGATVARKGYKSAGRHAGAPQSDGGRNGQLVEEAHG